MNDIEDKHYEHLAKMKVLGGMDKWYSWESPVGLGIFLLILAISVSVLKIAFFK